MRPIFRLPPPKEWKDLTLSKKQKKPPKTELKAEAQPRMPLSARPGYLVRRLHQIHSAIFLEECQAFAITPVQYGLISTLLTHPGADQVTLGGEVGIDRTNVADVLKRLTERGLVRRERSKTDGRSMVAFLTKEGERVAEEMYESMRRAQDRLLLPLRPEFRAAFLAMLTELIEGNSKYGLPDAGSDARGNKGPHLDD
jgi:DNA-binding MarR family transcriptional regulator